MPSVEVGTRARPAPSGDGQLGAAIRSACGLYFADEVLSSVRHDILNRMTALGALSFELRRGLESPGGEVRERLEDVNRQIGLVCETLSRRLAPPRIEPPPRCAVRRVAERVAGMCGRAVEVELAPATRLFAAIEPVQLGVALLCVVENAVEACDDRPRAVRVGFRGPEDERIAIEVSDHGPGLVTQVEARAFERFFTTKEGHAGLGLSVARTLLGRWQGDLQLSNRAGGGALATLSLPVSRRGKSER